MNEHVSEFIQDYIDGELSFADASRIGTHLESCEVCRREHAELATLLARLRSLPRRAEPERDLWKGIASRLRSVPGSETSNRIEGEQAHQASSGRTPHVWTSNEVHESTPSEVHDSTSSEVPDWTSKEVRHPAGSNDLRAVSKPPLKRRRSGARTAALVGTIVLLISTAIIALIRSSGAGSWQVDAIAGLPLAGGKVMEASRELHGGDWLITDGLSRARLHVGFVGSVEVDPNSRVQLHDARIDQYRIALDRGRIEARIFAPPRLFIVDTPSATAVDLGCVYTLEVDSTGMSSLHVTSGYVELVRDGRTGVVPAGAMALAHPEHGLGTAFAESATPSLRAAVVRYDFEGSRQEDLNIILQESGEGDAITLWQLVEREEEDRRRRVYERLVEIIEPPSGVTLEGVLRGDPEVYQIWRIHLDLEGGTWMDYLWRKIAFQ